ncbi:hypothetical protein ACGFY9_34055 [Streptomyces sp. NPDC048504]|uniref:hypothetical protein n=1 Tax=Streptomyces sp. NPDC048504 TaxID=3365559 RepID=UPI003714044D
MTTDTTASTAACTTIRVDARPGAGRPISADLFGACVEDINYAVDGGLYAARVQNRSCEHSAEDAPGRHSLAAWDAVRLGGGRGELRTETVDRLHPVNLIDTACDRGLPVATNCR